MPQPYGAALLKKRGIGAVLVMFLLGSVVGLTLTRVSNAMDDSVDVSYSGNFMPGDQQGASDDRSAFVYAAPVSLPLAAVAPMVRDDRDVLALPRAHAAYVMDVASRATLYDARSKERRPIASLTKLMTALLVVERVDDLNRIVTADTRSLNIVGTVVGCPRSGYCPEQRIVEGEQLRVIDLLHAMLMSSANDAATLLATFVSGSPEQFVTIMNERARAMGLMDTHFCTPSGLEPEGRERECYSTAHDIAVIAATALSHDLLWEIMRVPEMEIRDITGTYVHKIGNTDQLLGSMPGLIGAKTGFTPNAGLSLLLAAHDPVEEDRRVVAVVLNSPTRWEDIQRMVNWAFRSYVWL